MRLTTVGVADFIGKADASTLIMLVNTFCLHHWHLFGMAVYDQSSALARVLR
jgi:hypothetical protein